MRWSNGNRVFSVTVRYHDAPSWDWSASYPMDLDFPDFSGPMAMQYFSILRNVLDLAQDRGLKVILLCCNPNSGLQVETSFNQASDITAVHVYTAYLLRLAAELRDEPALLAYDLFNEPRSTYDGHPASGNTMQWTKSQVCGFTSEWYDAIHAQDPNHLVTLGGQAPYDIEVWDPSAMKLDFYSAHFYPQFGPAQYTGSNVQTATHMVGKELYWLGSTCSMPYIVGETGFSAEDDTENPPGETNLLDAVPAHHQYPFMYGSESEQAAYAQYSMDATRNYLGSGYSWWEFQNIKWYRLPPPSHPVAGQYSENFFGPLKYGDNVNPWYDKQVVSTFENYVLPLYAGSLPSEPLNYHNWYNCNGLQLEKWFLWDQYNQPIVGANVQCRYHYNSSHEPYGAVFDIDNTLITGLDGQVSIKGSASFPGTYYLSWYEAWVKVPGAKMRYYSNSLFATPSIYFPDWGSTVTMARDHMDFDGVDSGINIPIGGYRDVKAWNSITVANSVVHGNATAGGSADFHARQSIHLAPGTDFQQGSEVHVWTEATFADCGNMAYHSMAVVDDGSNANASTLPHRGSAEKALHLRFAKEDALALSVYPNPCRDEITVMMEEAGGLCVIQSPDGRTLYSQIMDGASLKVPMTSYASGTYVVTIHLHGRSYAKTITKTQ